MYIYRAINEFDEKIDPIKNGLIAKSIIGPILHHDFDILVYAMYIGKEDNPFLYMEKNEIERIYREVRKKFEISLHVPKIVEIADKNQEKINEVFKGILANQNVEYVKKLLDILSTKNGHITKGSTKDYPWISFTTSLEKAKHYYENQEKNIVVVVDSDINKFFDVSENAMLLALDLSSNEKIKNNEFIINANKTGTSLNYRGLNYAKKDSEVIYYNRVPKDKIVTVLTSLQYELLLNGLLDEGYYEIPENKKYYWKDIVLFSIRELLKDNGDIINYLLEEYYNKNFSLKSLSENGEHNLAELNEANEFILNKIKGSTKVKEKIRLR